MEPPTLTIRHGIVFVMTQREARVRFAYVFGHA